MLIRIFANPTLKCGKAHGFGQSVVENFADTSQRAAIFGAVLNEWRKRLFTQFFCGSDFNHALFIIFLPSVCISSEWLRQELNFMWALALV